MLGCRREGPAPRVYRDAPVIIISIDTLRADHLPMFGYGAIATPNLDAFRRDAILFRAAYSQVPLTLPSHVSLLTGLLPPDHKVRNNIGYVVRHDLPTIPGMLKARGYATGAAVSAYVLRGATGLSHSFDFYDDGILSKPNVAIGILQRPGRTTVPIATRWIEQHRDQPFFFFLHLFEPHAPYEPSYDGEIVTVDALIGSFIGELKRTGLYDKAIIFILSDHGEGLGDHGEPEHGIFVYREAIHVPLLLKLPKSERGGETVDAPVALIDVLPTVAELSGTQLPRGPSGRSLLAPADPTRHIYSESLYPRIHLGWSELRSLAGDRYHFIQAPKLELYDMQRDPAERRNVIGEERRTYASMRDALAKYGTALELPTKIDPEEAKKLAALGYLSSTPQSSGTLPDPKDRIGEIAAMVHASQLLQDRRYDQAISEFRSIVKTNPRLTDAWNQLGSALEASGRDEEAAEVYKTAIQATPELAAEFALKRGSVLLKLEKYDEAEQHARIAEKTNPTGMWLLLARIDMARKRFDRAAQEAQKAAADSSERLRAEVLLAQIYTQQGRLAEALALTDRIAGNDAGPLESLDFVRGDILARMERYDEAIAAFRREIQNFPQDRQTYANLYLVYRVTNRPDEARQTLEEMVRAIPNRSAYLFAARTVAALGEDKEAAMWRRRAEAFR